MSIRDNIYKQARRIALSKHSAIYVRSEGSLFFAEIQVRLEEIVYRISLQASSIENLNQKIEMIYRSDKKAHQTIQKLTRYNKFCRIKKSIENLFLSKNGVI